MPDLRELIDREHATFELPAAHKNRFEQKLKREHINPKRANFFFLKIAASIVILVGLAYTFWPASTGVDPVDQTDNYDIATVSPELKEIENNYVAAINLELLGIVPTNDNKALLDAYLKKVAELVKEYKKLSNDLITKEVSEERVNALIHNLQLRLQLLVELKDNLKEIEINKKRENENII